jgi:hypothetical protein
MLTYHDPALGRSRFKRRYVWGAWAFAAGLVLGFLLGQLI